MSVEEYLAFEQSSEARHEFVVGIALDLGDIYEKVSVPPPGLRLREGDIEYDAP